MDDPAAASIQTVFCAFDFSETAETALAQAVRFARRDGGRVVLGHVVEPIPLGPYPVMVAASNELAIQDIARRRIEDRAQALREDGVEVEVQVEQGEPGARLISMAESLDADLVVIGTRGLTGLKHLVMGSTAEYVVRRCPRPVLTVHPGDVPLESAIKTVVLPSDLSASAEAAAKTFMSLFARGALPRVHLLYADRSPPYLEPFRHEQLQRWNLPDTWKDEIESKLAPVAELLRGAGFEVEVSVLDGDPVSVTTELAEEHNADLILLSTRGRSALMNVLLGRTAQRIVQHAPCPVLTVRGGTGGAAALD